MQNGWNDSYIETNWLVNTERFIFIKMIKDSGRDLLGWDAVYWCSNNSILLEDLAAASIFKKVVSYRTTTRRLNPEGHNLNPRCRENLNSGK